MTGGQRSDPFLEQATERVAGAYDDVNLSVFQLALALTRASNRMARHVESSVHRPRNLTTAGFRILFTIWSCGPLEAHRIALLAGLSRASVSSVVNTLETRRPRGALPGARRPPDGDCVAYQFRRGSRP